MRTEGTDENRDAFASEMRRLRTHLGEWFEQDLEDVPDGYWAEAALRELKSRGFLCIEKVTDHEVLFCLGRKGIVHVSRAPTRSLAIARSIRQFADNGTEAVLLSPAGDLA